MAGRGFGDAGPLSSHASYHERMQQQTVYRFLSAAMPGPDVTAHYSRTTEGPRPSVEALDQYPYLGRLSPDWLRRYDESALDEVDRFLTSGDGRSDAEQAGHDIAVYLCNWVVANSATAHWVLDEPVGTCFVQLGPQRLDPYLYVVQCVHQGQPVARRFVEQVRSLGG